ncbi:MAG: RsmB/NOP family class I SAM-dependent RNA methyltransferase, partial [Candidatus Puniceispirillales bacterium]
DSDAEWVTRWRHDHAANFPDWIKTRLIADWGKEKANDIMAASLTPPPLDLTMAEHETADIWAEKLGGYVLPQASVRLNEGAPHRLDGYADGKWWVQDAAATLPVRIMGDIGGKQIIDACAAPGGKCAQLIASGADVTAIDQSASRLERLKENLTRLHMDATVINTDILSWSPDAPVDAVLIDAPCSATGTIRRNPDKLVHQKIPDITKLAELQMAMITHAATWLKPGGILVFATCSLFRAEGEEIAARIATETDLWPDAIDTHIYDGFVPYAGNDAHMLRLFPDALTYPQNASNHIKSKNTMIHGNDGFFMARFYRR